MSSDGYFEDDLDDAAFKELDAIEARFLPSSSTLAPQPTTKPSLAPALARENSDYFDLTFDIDESELQKIDNIIADAYQDKPAAGSSKPTRVPSRPTAQTTLFGEVLSPEASLNNSSSSSRSLDRIRSHPRNPFGQQAPKTKQWDHTEFAKTGLKRGKSKGKGKPKSMFDDDVEEEEEEVEFEQFPAPFVSLGPPPPMKLVPDLLEAKHWIYPLNHPKRDYQFNIVKHCLFENTLVALPTGLGKTFIAGVVMLNFYRWFPEGKVVFVAPTKPLVAQQIDACHKTCGIPGSDAAELSGEVQKSIRGRAWKQKRVLFMTPQTLVNDLTSGNCDVRDIVLLVIDEAHKGTGDYAYAQVIRFLMAKNPHFRVLAITATPGSTPDAVQALIDALHISHIEIRDENSLDLKAYIHKKEIKQHIITMNEDVNKVKDLLAKLIDKELKPVMQRGLLRGADPVKLHPFRPQAESRSLARHQKWAYGPLSLLSSLARAMGYLLEGTMGMCYTFLQALSRDDETEEHDGASKKAASRGKKLRSDPMFQAVIKEIESQRSRGFVMHPKMDMLKRLIVQHFAERMGEEGGEPDKETRVMVFVTYREVVDEIVEALNLEKPLIRATKFVGQATDKQGKRGLAQREQLEIIKRFKAGEFNVLVATSIGEEGLDIGEIDLIVCYDAQKTPIRMLQRVGRTGRKRTGYVHVLLAEVREEGNLDKAKDTYKEVQKSMWRGDQLELYGDVERLLPDHIKPECLEKVMDIVEYVRGDLHKRSSRANADHSPKGPKRKRNDDIGRNIPAGASTGFVSVADLLVKGTKRQKVAPAPPKDFELAGLDDDTDLEIEDGRVLPPLRRAESAGSALASKPKKPKKLRTAATMNGKKATATKAIAKKKKMKKVEPSLTSSQFSQKAVDDSDDMEIERGIIVPQCRSSSSPVEVSSTHVSKRSSDRRSSSIDIQIDARSSLGSPSLATFASPDQQSNTSLSPISSPAAPRSPPQDPPDGVEDQSIAWLVADDDDIDIDIVNSSPVISKRSLSPSRPVTDDESIEFVEHTRMSPSLENQGTRPYSYSPPPQADDSVEFLEPQPRAHTRLKVTVKSHARTRFSTPPRTLPIDEADESVEFIVRHSTPTTTRNLALSPSWLSSPMPVTAAKPNMPPPELPARFSTSDGPTLPDPTFPVRPLRRPRNRATVVVASDDSPALEMPPPSQRRLHRQRSSSPVPAANNGKRRHRGEDRLAAQAFIDTVAAHSGDEISEGYSDAGDDMPSEGDLSFVRDVPETQMPVTYNQELAYRQSLMTQAPLTARVPVFARRPMRRGVFAGGGNSGRRIAVSSSPDRDVPDEYALGSFVVDDEAEISYMQSSNEDLQRDS